MNAPVRQRKQNKERNFVRLVSFNQYIEALNYVAKQRSTKQVVMLEQQIAAVQRQQAHDDTASFSPRWVSETVKVQNTSASLSSIEYDDEYYVRLSAAMEALVTGMDDLIDQAANSGQIQQSSVQTFKNVARKAFTVAPSQLRKSMSNTATAVRANNPDALLSGNVDGEHRVAFKESYQQVITQAGEEDYASQNAEHKYHEQQVEHDDPDVLLRHSRRATVVASLTLLARFYQESFNQNCSSFDTRALARSMVSNLLRQSLFNADECNYLNSYDQGMDNGQTVSVTAMHKVNVYVEYQQTVAVRGVGMDPNARNRTPLQMQPGNGAGKAHDDEELDRQLVRSSYGRGFGG